MTVYIWIVAISVAMTIGTFFHHALLRNWYDVFLVLPIWLGWFLAATALYFLLLYLISLTVDKSKPVRKKEPFFRWLLNQTVWLMYSSYALVGRLSSTSVFSSSVRPKVFTR